MSNRYSLSPTDSLLTSYRVIDRSRDGEVALHPATLPSGAPHPLAGQPISIVTSPAPAYEVQGEGRARTWGELGGYAVAVIESVPPGPPPPPLARPLRVRRPRPLAPPRPGAPHRRSVSLSDVRTRPPRYLHLGTGALGRLRGLHGLPLPLP